MGCFQILWPAKLADKIIIYGINVNYSCIGEYNRDSVFQLIG